MKIGLQLSVKNHMKKMREKDRQTDKKEYMDNSFKNWL